MKGLYMFLWDRRLIVLLSVIAVLLPLCRRENTMTKKREIILEFNQTTDYDSYFGLRQRLKEVEAEAFADECKDFLLDAHFNIRQEYVDLIGKIKEAKRKEFMARIELAKADRKTRVEACMKKIEQEQTESLEYLKNHPEEIDKINALHKAIFSIVKNKNNKILGFAIFCNPLNMPKQFIWLDKLAVIPAARGQGLATMLIRSIERQKPEITKIFLKTQVWNIRAQKVYEHLGFKVYKRDGCDMTYTYDVHA